MKEIEQNWERCRQGTRELVDLKNSRKMEGRDRNRQDRAIEKKNRIERQKRKTREIKK